MAMDEITENMKAVLKKTQKSKHKKPHKAKEDAEENETELSEILSKNWKFSSPPGSLLNKKVNAFEIMMAKKPEPLSQILPEVNGIKRKRRHEPRSNPKVNKSESPDQSLMTAEGVEVFTEERRKRSRSSDTPIANNSNKKKKVKAYIGHLDSNDNLLPAGSEVDRETDDDSISRSGRPRRSCAGKIKYDLWESPEKARTSQRDQSVPKRTTKTTEDTTFFISPKKPMKLAKIFLKKLPKPNIDPVAKQLRRDFLLSGLPQEMRLSIDKQKQFEDEMFSNELIAFPSISHVTQFHSDEITNCLWQNSIVNLNPDDINGNTISGRLLKSGVFTESLEGDFVAVECDEISPIELEPIENVKVVVKLMKETFEHFPTNRCFRQLYWKLRNKEFAPTASLLFVDIFKPQTFQEFIVNAKPVKELRMFLTTRNEENFISTDDSMTNPSSMKNNNFAILTGTNGTGKTSSVYAIAKELNYTVIEINAGSRRSGKKMLQDLLEATQSHRVRDKSLQLKSDYEASQLNARQPESLEQAENSLILIEDSELAFDDIDDGFVSTLQQLIYSSKRPIILTSNNRKCHHLQKYLRQNEILYQKPKSTSQIGKYLSLLCLAANYQTSADEMSQLYKLNHHDLRKTINEIEFFVRSGNSRTSCEFKTTPQAKWTDRGHVKYENKSISMICFQSSIHSSFVGMADRRACNASSQQRNFIDEMEDFFTERVAETRFDLAHGKTKIER